jgi:hypothetical protein
MQSVQDLTQTGTECPRSPRLEKREFKRVREQVYADAVHPAVVPRRRLRWRRRYWAH